MKYICRDCGSETNGKTHTPGYLGIEIILWLCYIVPGLIYSIWRHCARTKVCAVCGSEALLPAGTPAASRAARSFASE